jgi:hypothetical protein
MKQIAFYVDDTGANQLNYFLSLSINNFFRERYDYDILFFTNQKSKHAVEPNFSVMHETEIFAYPGDVVATSFVTAEKILNIPNIRNRFFYLYDLEWLHSPRDFYENIKVYKNKKISLLTRNREYAKIITKAWKRHVTILTDDNIIGDFVNNHE